MKIKRTKALAILFLTSITLVGCSLHKDEIKINVNEKQNNKIENSENLIDSKDVFKIEADLQEKNPDEIIKNYLNEVETELNNIREDETLETIKEKTTSYFITLVDFIFYDTEINGITFDQLSEEMKKTTLQDLLLIDSIIDKYFPDYKENLSSKYIDLKEKIYNLALDKLGQENLNKLEESKDEFFNSLGLLGDVAEDLSDSGKTKIKNWYDQFRNNN